MVDELTRCRLSPQVSLRGEPFGALAYHFGNRRLSFLRHHDMVRVVERLDGRATVGEVLDAVGVKPRRRPSFLRALDTMRRSEMIEVLDVAEAVGT